MAQATVKIAAKNETSQGINSAKKNIQSLEDVVSSLSSKLGKAVGVTSAAVALKKLGDAAVACFNEFNSASRTYQQIQLALGNGEAYKKVTSTIDTLSKQTLEGKTSIESMVSQLAALGHSADEIDKISSASVYLSNVTGKSLNESMNMLLGTYQGSTDELKKLGLNVGNFTKEQLASGAAVDEVISSLQGYSEAMAEVGTSQHLTNISNTWTDIKRTIGDIIDTSVSPLIESFDTVFSDFSTKFQEVAEKVKTIISNFPEFWEGVCTFIKNSVSSLFSYEGIKAYFQHLASVIPKSVQLILDNVINLLQLSLNTIPSACEAILDGIGNYAMYLVTSLCNDIGVDLNELINSIGTWLTESNIGQAIDSFLSNVVNSIKLVGAIIKNIPEMVQIVCDNIGPITKNLFISIKNFFLQATADMATWLAQTIDKINFPQMIENVRVAFVNLFGRVGGFFSALGATAKDTFRYIGEILEVTFSWDTLKTIITTLFKNIGAILSAWLSTIFGTIPSMIGNVFAGIVEWIGYVGVKIKNSILSAIQGAINNAGKKIQGTWVGKVFGLGDSLASVDLGIDTSKEEQLLNKAKNSFSNVGDEFTKAIDRAVDTAATIQKNNQDVADKYSGIEGVKVAGNTWTDVEAETKDSGDFVEQLYTWADSLVDKKEDNSAAWAEIGEKFDALLSPVIEEWESSTGETIGQKLSKFVAKDSEAYLELAKGSFSSIGEFFTEWGSDFIADNKEGFGAIWDDFKEFGSSVFGDQFDEFEAWMSSFFEEHPTTTTTGTEGTTTDTSTGSNTTPYAGISWNSIFGTDGTIDSWFDGLRTSQESVDSGLTSGLTGAFDGLLDSIGPLADILMSSNPWIALLMTLITEICEQLGPFLTEVMEPFNNVISNVAKIIVNMIVPLLEPLGDIIGTLSEMLMMAIVPALSALQPIINIIKGSFNILAGVLEKLNPVVKFIGTVIDFVTTAIWYAIGSFLNWLDGLSIFGWRPFAGVGVGSVEKPSWANSKAKMEEAASSVYSNDEEDTSTSTSVSTASYTGSNNYYFNIYQQAPVVGDGGMQEFAKMIKSEFAELAYLSA